MDSTVKNCEFERIDGDPDIERNVAIACGGCALKEVGGKATLMVDDEGFTNVIDGVCPRFGIYGPFNPQEFATEQVEAAETSQDGLHSA